MYEHKSEWGDPNKVNDSDKTGDLKISSKTRIADMVTIKSTIITYIADMVSK